MSYQAILNNIKKHIALSEEETNIFTSLIHLKYFDKKETLLNENSSCKNFYFVNSGCLKAVHTDKDLNENIIMFAFRDWWITDMYSFTTGKPSMLSIESIYEGSVCALNKKDMDKLCIKIPKFERFFRIIMQNAYIREQVRVIENLSMSAEERYLKFIQRYPEISLQISKKQIASYLGITPEFLSVIRKKTST